MRDAHAHITPVPTLAFASLVRRASRHKEPDITRLTMPRLRISVTGKSLVNGVGGDASM